MKKVVLLAAVVLLSACVTTQKGVYTSKADKQKALDYSVQLANQYISQGNWDAAKRHLRYAQEVDSRHAPTHEALARLFENTGEVELAEEHYRDAIRLDKSFVHGRHNYAVFLYNRQRYREAAEQLEVVADEVLYENRFSAFLSLGKSYMELEEYGKAAKAFQRAHLLQRESPTALLALANAEYELGNYIEAQKRYDRYRQSVKKQSARGLWLGIRLADHFGDENARASYALALQNLYPSSREYLAYREYQRERDGSGN